MPEQLAYPGVYIEEISTAERTIAGVATSVTAFLGAAARGPVSKATRISSFADFERIFGGLSTDSEMSYGVRQFFLNGGRDAWIVRIVKSATLARLPLVNSKAATVLTVTALDAGTSGNDIQVGVDYATPTPDSRFNISFTRSSDGYAEHYLDASMNSADARYLPNLVNGISQLVSLIRDVSRSRLNALAAGSSRSGTLADVQTLLDATHTDFEVAVNGLPPVTVSLALPADIAGRTPTQRLTSLARTIKLKVRGQAAGNPALSGFSCTRSGQTLLMKSGVGGEFSSVRVLPGRQNNAASVLKLGTANGGIEIDAVAGIRPVPLPDLANPAAAFLVGGSETPCGPADVYPAFTGNRASRQGLYALDDTGLFNLLVMPGITDAGVLADAAAYCTERRAFLIVDAPLSASNVSSMVAVMAGQSLPKSDHAALYFPWTTIADPLNNGQPRLTPPSGSVAGLYARIDNSRGVWKAPAGTEAHLASVQSLALQLTDADNGRLNPLGVNCLRTFPVNGTVAWGARTLRGSDALASEYKYVPVRRMALYIEESLFRGTQWAVFEPNDEALWAQIRSNIDAFMYGLFRQGAFQGNTPREAYLVKCDRETTTQNDIDNGMVNILVGFAPLKPAEFVIIRMQQQAGQTQG
ncbi:MAG: hypothetical protein A2040_05135 [Rhodocyclales bacterium GWA2_65_19]|nr:MAG: hypothetical protein A2040_05135 [Rhodocyclales bacterium GWA2_65_19]